MSVPFDVFCQDLLAPWVDDAPIAADATGHTPMMVAKLALHAAATITKTGVILVVVPSATEQRLVQSYVDAMSDQPLLRSLRQRIEVSTLVLAPLVQGVAHVVQMSGAPHEEASMDPAEATRRALHIALTSELSPGMAAFLRTHFPGEDPHEVLDRWSEEARARSAKLKKEEWNVAPARNPNISSDAWPKPVSVPQVPRPAGVGPDGYYTQEHELALMEAHTAIKPEPPTVITRSSTRYFQRRHGR